MILDILTHKPALLKKIFAKDESGKYTNKAQRYQHLVNFFLSDENHFFKITEIQNILFDFPTIFNIDSEGYNSSYIRHNRNRQFNDHLQKLEESQVIISNKTQSIRGLSNVKEYKLSKFGKTIALIIEFILSDKKQEIYEKIYGYWKSYLNNNSTSLTLFCLAYLDKCKDRGLFNTFVDFFIDNVLYRNSYIRNNQEFFTQLILVKFEDDKENKIFYELWRNAFEDLDEKTALLT
jgi:hypothetical protein